MEEQVLTVETLVRVGAYGAFSELYDDIHGVLSMVEAEFEEANKTLFPYEIERAARGELNHLLDDFLASYTYLFTNRYERLHPNASAMTCMRNLYNEKKTGVMQFSISFISFRQFLKRFEDFIIEILVSRSFYDKDVRATVDRWKTERVKLKYHLSYLSSDENQSIWSSEHIADKLEEVIVYRNLKAISCNRQKHIVETDILTVPLAKSERQIKLPIHHCKTCGKLFVGEGTLKAYEDVLDDKVLISRSDDKEQIKGRVLFGESELHRAGYNVIEGEMSETDRRNLLTKLYDLGFFSDFEIRRDIENAISIFDGKPRYYRAVEKWKSDLHFFSEYVKQKL